MDRLLNKSSLRVRQFKRLPHSLGYGSQLARKGDVSHKLHNDAGLETCDLETPISHANLFLVASAAPHLSFYGPVIIA